MENTIGRYAYNLVFIPMQNECTLALVCSDSLQVDEVKEFVEFQLKQNDFTQTFQGPSAIDSDAPKSMTEWMHVNEEHRSIQTYQRPNSKAILPKIINRIDAHLVHMSI